MGKFVTYTSYLPLKTTSDPARRLLLLTAAVSPASMRCTRSKAHGSRGDRVLWWYSNRPPASDACRIRLTLAAVETIMQVKSALDKTVQRLQEQYCRMGGCEPELALIEVPSKTITLSIHIVVRCVVRAIRPE